MRVWIGLLVFAALGCKKKAETPPATGSGSATAVVADAAAAVDAAVAPVADMPFCWGEGDPEDVTVIASDDKAVTFCVVTDEGDPTKCARFDVATGALSGIPKAARPADKPVGKQPDAAALGLPTSELAYLLATSPDGKTTAATNENAPGKLYIVQTAPKKAVREIKVTGAEEGCMEQPQFIGDNIYVQYNVCAGPGATGVIYTPAGKKLGMVEDVNPTGTFFKIADTHYAFEDFGGETIQVVDAATGKTVRKIEIKPPADCGDDGCPPKSPHGLELVQAGTKLVQLGNFISVVDPMTGKIEKQAKYPACEKKQ